MLTRVGNVFAGRVAGSLLTALSLPELITYSAEEYQAQAIRLAKEPEALRVLKARLDTSLLTAPLFRTDVFTGNLEAAYMRMVERYRSGLPPQPFAV